LRRDPSSKVAARRRTVAFFWLDPRNPLLAKLRAAIELS
jgi:hypothetical protein